MTRPDGSPARQDEAASELPGCEDCAEAGRPWRAAHDVDTVRDRYVCRPCEVASWPKCTRCSQPEARLVGGLCWECRHPEELEDDDERAWWPPPRE